MNTKFNIYNHLTEMGLQTVSRLDTDLAPYGSKDRHDVSYYSTFVIDAVNGKAYSLINHVYLLSNKSYYFLVDVSGNVTKINGGKLGANWVEQAQTQVKRCYYTSCELYFS